MVAEPLGNMLCLRLAGLKHQLVYASECHHALRKRIKRIHDPTTLLDDATDPIRAPAKRMPGDVHLHGPRGTQWGCRWRCQSTKDGMLPLIFMGLEPPASLSLLREKVPAVMIHVLMC